jgi:FkbM family methyltransferase
MEVIFDVGAFDASDYLERCKDPNCHVYAFEPQPLMIERIRQAACGLPNFHLFEGAVADFDGQTTLHLSGGGQGGCSSILDYRPHQEWGNKKFDKKYSLKVPVISLKTFMAQHGINHIDYLHIDAQGMDLKILQGLGEYHKFVKSGDMEVQIFQLYEGAHTLAEVEAWMKKQGWQYEYRHTPPDRETNVFFTNPAYDPTLAA